MHSDKSSNILLTHPEIEVEYILLNDHRLIVFEFRNQFTLDAAKAAVKCWSAHNQEQQQSAIHIWNCRRMSGFEMASKKIWMNHMRESGELIERIILISEMILIRGAARLMSKFSKHRLDVYRSLKEMQKKEGFVISASLEQS